jgi:CPA2 family monovalent cation:H+ antiporter-2
MSINVRLVLDNITFTAALVVTMVFGKFSILVMATLLFRYPGKVSLKVGMGMIQIGEFSFIIAEMGYSSGAISASLYSITISGALITMVLTPYSMKLSEPLYKRMCKIPFLTASSEDADTMHRDEYEEKQKSLKDHTIVIGVGRVGRYAVDALIHARQEFVVIDFDPVKVAYLRELGLNYLYGDASHHRIIENGGGRSARLVVIALPNARDTVTIVKHVRQLNPDCSIIARVQSSDVKLQLDKYNVKTIQPEIVTGMNVVWHIQRILKL